MHKSSYCPLVTMNKTSVKLKKFWKSLFFVLLKTSITGGEGGRYFFRFF